jgi:thiamine-phosphate pyrophosphorylase
MCLTRDGTGVPHAEQAERLCAGGARWIQLRMKGADHGEWLREAKAAVRACRRHGAVLVVNDSALVAAESGADGVHLGATDLGWAEARQILGAGRLVGGTVNSPEAAASLPVGLLDYAGVGPLRFTATKERIAPVLGPAGVAATVAALGGIPAWAIGGVLPADSPALRAAGARGIAVCAPLHAGNRFADNLAPYLAAWPAAAPQPAFA